MRRTLPSLIAGITILGCLTGCPSEPSSSGAKGTVVDRSENRRAKCSIRSCYTYKITVKEGGGKKDKGRVSEKVYEACQIGDRWPDCKRGAKG